MFGDVSFNCISDSLCDRIYAYLDNQCGALGAFRLTCKRFYALSQENEKFKKVAEVVLSYYVVCVTNSRGVCLWQLLKNSSVYLVGESHSEDWHRQIFALFVHKIWDDNAFSLRVEGGVKRLPQTGQIKYIDEPIGQANQSWDIVDEEFWNDLTRRITEFLHFSSQFLKVKDTRSGEKVNNLREILYVLENLFSEEEYLSLNKSIDTLDTFAPLLNEENYGYADVLCYLKLSFYLQYTIGSELYDCLFEKYKIFWEVVQATLPARNHEMVKNIKTDLTIPNKVIVIAGSEHVIFGENTPAEKLQTLGIPFISLIPKEDPIQNEQTKPQTLSEENPSVNIHLKKTDRERLKEFDALNYSGSVWELFHSFNFLEILIDEVIDCREKFEEVEDRLKALKSKD